MCKIENLIVKEEPWMLEMKFKLGGKICKGKLTMNTCFSV